MATPPPSSTFDALDVPCDECRRRPLSQGHRYDCPDLDTPCGCGYDLCGECMREPGPKKHMVVPGLNRAKDPR